MVTIRKPSVILLDIEGTTTDIGFVSKTLFPFIKANIGNYFNEAYNRVECQELIQRLRESQDSDRTDLPRVASVGEPRDDIIRSVTNYALANINIKRRISEIKQLQILVWVWGYDKQLLKGHVYDEVTSRMHVWKHHDHIKLYVFSSGMIAAQQLLLCCTNHGNCLPLITDFFDSSVGEKTDPKSFSNISAKIGQPLSRMLFITDSPQEAQAARQAKCQAAIIKRPNNKLKGIDASKIGIPIISSFDDIHFN